MILATSKDNHTRSFFVIALLVSRLVAIIQHPKVFFVSSGSLYAPKILLVQHPPTPALRLLLSASVPSFNSTALLGIRSRGAERKYLGTSSHLFLGLPKYLNLTLSLPN
jgi:hypothetical protein